MYMSCTFDPPISSHDYDDVRHCSLSALLFCSILLTAVILLIAILSLIRPIIITLAHIHYIGPLGIGVVYDDTIMH